MRRVLGLVIFLIGIAGLVWYFVRPQPVEDKVTQIQRKRRSILLVTMDTTRPDRLQPYGSEDVPTPNLNQIAEQGIVFEQAFSVAPITLVAHSSIMSGLYPPQHQVRNNGIHYASPQIETLAERLSESGYRTAAFVSAAVLEKRYGLDQGFEVYDDDLSTGRERHPRMVPDRPAEATVNAAMAWLDQLDEGDTYFLWVHLYDPHAPYSPPPPFRSEYRDRLYDGEIAYMDSQIGRLLAHPVLRSEHEPIVALIGDHGESLGEHEEQTHAVLAYDATLHVPFLLRIPGGPKGLRVTQEVSHVDVAPTLLDLIDHKASQVAGVSLVPLLESRVAQLDRYLYGETYLPFYTYGWAKLKTLRKGHWKYIDAPTPELYDLKRDPHELTNVYDQNPGRSYDYNEDLGKLMNSMGGGEDEALLAVDSDAMEQLRSLGYVSVGSGSAIASNSERPDPKEFIGFHVKLETARSFLRDGLNQESKNVLEEVLEIDPGNLAAMSEMAEALQRLGQLDRAVDVLLHSLELDPNMARTHMSLAQLEERRGNLEKALDVIDIAISLDGNSVQAKIQKALLLPKLDRAEDARSLIAELLVDEPDNPRVLTTHVQLVELKDQDYQAAEEKLIRATERDPFDVQAWRLLGNTLSSMGRSADALATYREGLKRRPDDAESHGQIGVLLARESGGTQVEMHLKEAIRQSKSFRPEWHVSLGAWYAANGQFKKADEQYQLVLENDPQNAMARNNQAIALYRTGKVAEAEAQLRSVVERHPEYADAWNNLSAILVNQTRWDEAATCAEKALALDPNVVEAWNNWGICLDETGQHKQAVERYQRALELNDQYWPAKNNLALALIHLGQVQEPIAILNEVLTQMPNHPEVHLELGHLYADQLKDWDKAQDHYNAFLRFAPTGHPEVGSVKDKLLDVLQRRDSGKNEAN